MQDTPKTFLEHFEELRKRLIIALASLGVAVLASFVFTDKILVLLTQPIGGLSQVQSIEVTENVGVFMRTSLLAGFILAFPVIVLPGLDIHPSGALSLGKGGLSILPSRSQRCFLWGSLFCIRVMAAGRAAFLLNFLGVETIPRLSSYTTFVTGLLFWVGVMFETPLVVFLLARFGVVTPRLMLRYWRHAVVVMAIQAAMITPTVDPVNMLLFMAPLMGLYFISILFAALAVRKPAASPRISTD